MRFALVGSELNEAQPGSKGICPGCNQPVLAKCGTERINHWAHLRSTICDSWWEPETEWHREWKNHFPKEWQETFLPDKVTGEKHMADVRTGHGLVLEFQHSHIDPQERISREKFYGNILWVVDGTRLKRDFTRFHKGKTNFIPAHRPGLFIAQFPDECFPSTWLNSLAPVFFDFRNIGPEGDFQDEPHCLYCLFSNTGPLDSLVAVITKEIFIELCLNGRLISFLKVFVDEYNQKRQLRQAYSQRQQQATINKYFFRQKGRRRF
jgi:competence protein CoiA